MIYSYCNYGICNEYTSQCLEEGDSVDRLSYWDDGNRVILTDVRITDIDSCEIIVETEDYDEITIPIEEIENWD